MGLIRDISGLLQNRIVSRVQLKVLGKDLSAVRKRTFHDDSGTLPTVNVEPGVATWRSHPSIFNVYNGSTWLKQSVPHSAPTLLKLIKDFKFNNILDVGAGDLSSSKVFAHLGVKVFTNDIAPNSGADYIGDFMHIKFPRKFDAIWASQVVEHQRNVGAFLDKIYDILEDDGIFAMTVPREDGFSLTFGHCNIFSLEIMIYHLVMAGFDCSDMSYLEILGDLCIIVRKKYNGISRGENQALIPSTDRYDENSPDVYPKMNEAWPGKPKLPHSVFRLKNKSMNWYPIGTNSKN